MQPSEVFSIALPVHYDAENAKTIRAISAKLVKGVCFYPFLRHR